MSEIMKAKAMAFDMRELILRLRLMTHSGFTTGELSCPLNQWGHETHLENAIIITGDNIFITCPFCKKDFSE